jgi:hypothetical protein
VLGFPRFYHEKLADAMDGLDGDTLHEMIGVCTSLRALRQRVEHPSAEDAHGDGDDSNDNDDTPEEAEEQAARIFLQLRAIRARYADNPAVRVASGGLEILLRLLSSSPSPLLPPPAPPASTRLARLADELRFDVEAQPVQPCVYMDMTSCTIMLGAIAAAPGSATRAWFVDKLRRVYTAMRDRGWDNPLRIVEGLLSQPDSGLIGHIKSLWAEVERG